MGFFDKALGAIAPGWAVSRARNKMLLRAYEAAQPSRLNKARRESRSADTAVFSAGTSLREQARALDEDHDIVIGLLDKLEERVIGAQGIQVEPQPLRSDGTLHELLAEQISALWSEWSVRPEVTGMFTRPEAERMALRSALRDGEMFVQLVRGPVAGLNHSTVVPLSLELLEADFVPVSLNTNADQQVRQGIILNNWGRPVGYRVYKYHPANMRGFSADLKTVHADNMLHLAMRKRLHQVRGVSLLHGVIRRIADLKDYEESERVAARIAAALGFYIKRGDAASFPTDNDWTPTEQKPRYFDISPGMIFDELAPGEDLGMVESNRPNVHLYEFRNGQLRAVAAGTRGSYSSIARDYNGSYSSQRQELVEGYEGYGVLQQWFVGQYSRPVYRAWLEQAIPFLEIPPDVDMSTLFNATYLGPVMPWIDPVKEAAAWRAILRGGAGTEAEWIRARGQSPQEVKRQRLRETEFNRENGLVFDSDAANDKGVIPDAANDKPASSRDDD
ncbi:phage portal protein [Escherichia coli]